MHTFEPQLQRVDAMKKPVASTRSYQIRLAVNHNQLIIWIKGCEQSVYKRSNVHCVPIFSSLFFFFYFYFFSILFYPLFFFFFLSHFFSSFFPSLIWCLLAPYPFVSFLPHIISLSKPNFAQLTLGKVGLPEKSAENKKVATPVAKFGTTMSL